MYFCDRLLITKRLKIQLVLGWVLCGLSKINYLKMFWGCPKKNFKRPLTSLALLVTTNSGSFKNIGNIKILGLAKDFCTLLSGSCLTWVIPRCEAAVKRLRFVWECRAVLQATYSKGCDCGEDNCSLTAQHEPNVTWHSLRVCSEKTLPTNNWRCW